MQKARPKPGFFFLDEVKWMDEAGSPRKELVCPQFTAKLVVAVLLIVPIVAVLLTL